MIEPPSLPLRLFARFGAKLTVAALLPLVVLPVACGEGRDRARVAALEAGIASAQASLAAMSAGSLPGASVPRPASLAVPASARPASARPLPKGMAARPPSGSGPLAAAELLGAGPDELVRWFGEPDLRRREGDAEIILFLGPGCALDVVLYAAAGGRGARRVEHAAARADGPAAVTEADCLRGIGGWRGGVGTAVAAGHSPPR